MSFASAIAAAQKAARNATGGLVTYARGVETVTLTAGRGRSEFETERKGILIKLEARDFLIATAELILAGAVTLPARGDTISETVGDTTYTYEVLELNGEPAWRFADEYRQQLRVHTKRTG